MQKARTLKDHVFIEFSGNCDSYGCEAKFYRLGKSRYGIKLYTDFEIAKGAYERQRLAASHGLAPKVGKFVVAKKTDAKNIRYGYQTEKAREVFEDDPIYKKQSDSLYKKLKKLNLAGDFGDCNCGILKGKLVSVDFGSHSECEW